MDEHPTTRRNRPSRRRRWFFYAALLAFSGVAALAVAEIVLRVVPIPGITYHTFYYDPVTGGKLYPHTTQIFRGDDGVEIRRRVNAWGFPDVEHEIEREPGTLRIGFFGDSYTEAAQVTIDKTFFRLIEDDLNARIAELDSTASRHGEPIRRVETIAFGKSGWGALQSYLECGNWMARCDLDYVVYVFVENDPADHIRRLVGSDGQPYPVLAGDSFTVDNSFNDRYRYKTSWWHRAFQRIKSNSLVVSTLEGRLKLLARYGIKRKVTKADRLGEAGGGGSIQAPSGWPPDLVEDGWTLTTRVLDRWKRDVEAEGRRFVIMRVPREGQVGVPLAEQDSWAPRLHDYCARRGIPLVDPTPVFLSRMQAGERIYHHHFTPAGHRAFADAFVSFLAAAPREHH